MHEEQLLEFSNLSQEIADGDKSIAVEIYRMEGQSDWLLEVIDEYNNSIVWDSTFKNDIEALREIKKAVSDEGIDSLIGPEGGEAKVGWV